MLQRLLLLCACALALTVETACVSAPTVAELQSPEAVQLQSRTAAELLAMLSPEEQQLPEAQAEARWLARTVHRGAAAVARVNDPVLSGWLHNRMVNSSFHWKERGLCWQYQHDLYRELRRRPLQFYRIGCCVLDRGKGSEHHCLYLCEKNHARQDGIVFCAWRYSGHIKFWDADTLRRRKCEEEAGVAAFLNSRYPEGHTLPVEHWARVRADEGGMRHYLNSDTPQGAASRQGQLMRANCLRGLRERQGRPTDY